MGFAARGQPLEFNKNLPGNIYGVVPHAETFVTAVQLLGTVALVALAIAVSLTLSRIRRDSAKTDVPVTIRAARLARNQKLIRKLLYVGALALVAGALQASALYAWGITMIQPEKMVPYLASFDPSKSTGIPQLMGALNGAFYSLLLGIIFAPALIYMGVIADRLLEEDKPNAVDSVRNAWFLDYALDISVPQKLLSALAILAPMIAGGPLTSLIELIAR